MVTALNTRKLRAEINGLLEVQRNILAKAQEAGEMGDAEKATLEELKGQLRGKQGLLENFEAFEADQKKLGIVPDPNAEAEREATRTATKEDAEADRLKYRSFGEFLFDVAQEGLGRGRSEKLQYRAVSGMNEGAGAEGGFLVQTDHLLDIYSKAYGMGQIISRVRKVPLSPGSNGIKVPMLADSSRVKGSRWGGVQVYWGNEGETATATKPKMREMKLELKKLKGIAYATDELVADAAACEAIIGQAMTEEIQFEVEDQILNGIGGGMPLGILQSGALVSVAAEGGQSADTIIGANLVNMWARLWPRSITNAVWLYNQGAAGQLLSCLLPGTTTSAFIAPGGAGGANPFGSILGAPAVPCEQCAALGDVGDLLLVDLSQYALIDKGAIAQSSSMHVRFLEDEMAYKFVYRLDGQPVWNAALTPAKGSATLSPYIALAAR